MTSKAEQYGTPRKKTKQKTETQVLKDVFAVVEAAVKREIGRLGRNASLRAPSTG